MQLIAFDYEWGQGWPLWTPGDDDNFTQTPADLGLSKGLGDDLHHFYLF